MGVVYKLKQEIVDFILEQKRVDINISCRKLSGAVQEKFQIEVSKSSINAIIKQASLSSPVGRRVNSPGGALKPLKFKIPEEKKSQIFVDKKALQGLLPDEPKEEPPLLVRKEESQTPQIKTEFPIEGKKGETSKEIFPPVLQKNPPQPETPEQIPEQIIELPPPKVPNEAPQGIFSTIELMEDMAGHKPDQVPKTEENPTLKIISPETLNAIDTAAKEEPVPPQKTDEEPPTGNIEKPIVPEKVAEKKKEEAEGKKEIVPPVRQENPPSVISVIKEEARLAELAILSKQKNEDVAPPTIQFEAAQEIPLVKEPPVQEPLTEKPFMEKPPAREARYDGMGCFFLKAAQWQITHSPLLGELISRYSKKFLPSDASALSEILLYVSAFGIKKASDIDQYRGDGLWELNSLSVRPKSEAVTSLLNGISSPKNFSVAVANRYSQIFSEASYLKITLVGKMHLCFDAQCQSIWLEEALQPVFPLPLNKTLDYLSRNFISNNDPIIMRSVPGYKSFAKCFYDTVGAFEDFPEKRIEKITVHGSRKEEIAKFEKIPAKKRHFILGMWPWQDECRHYIEEDRGQLKPFYHELLQKEFYYSDFKMKLPQQAIGQSIGLRMIFIRESSTSWPVVGIMTNISDGAMPTEDVISAYLSRWPSLQNGQNDFVTRAESVAGISTSVVPVHDRIHWLEGEGHYNLLSGNGDVWLSIQFLLAALNNYCQRHFFPVAYEKLDFAVIRERVYSLPGTVEKKQGALIVSLTVPEGYLYQKDLEYALRRLNESDTKSPEGQRVFLRISNK